MAAEIASISSLEKPLEEKDVLPSFRSSLFAADSMASVLMSIVLHIPLSHVLGSGGSLCIQYKRAARIRQADF